MFLKIVLSAIFCIELICSQQLYIEKDAKVNLNESVELSCFGFRLREPLKDCVWIAPDGRTK